jgi:hypothetical protein
MYYSKKLARLRANEILFIREDYPRAARAPSGVSLSSRPKSFTFTFLESSFQIVRVLASGVLRAPMSSLPPCFQNRPITGTTGTADSDIARGIYQPGVDETQLTARSSLQRFAQAWRHRGEGRTRRAGV